MPGIFERRRPVVMAARGHTPLSEELAGVHPEWVNFLEKTNLLKTAADVFAEIDAGTAGLMPPKCLVFEFLRYCSPDDVLVVILGQDPYPQDAQGVCFSTPPRMALKPSLKSLLRNLENHKLAREHFREKDNRSSPRVHSGDLRTWAPQGVLLMNAALTTQAGKRGAHRKAWKIFTGQFLRELSRRHAAAGTPIIFMFWGNDARAYASKLEHGEARHPVYVWTHPSPLVNNRLPPSSKFEAAPHFVAANKSISARSLRPVEWDPLAYTHAFTDGSCSKNGKKDAMAGYAVCLLSGPLNGVELAGRVSGYTYEFEDPQDLFKGFRPTRVAATPTNNRGEYLAWCWALLLLLRGGVRGRVEIVSDCNLFIQTMTTWLPARRQKETGHKLKNYDLICIADRLLTTLKAENVFGEAGVVLTHINSHQPRPPKEASARDHLLWHGNARADREACAALTREKAQHFAPRAKSLRWQLLERHRQTPPCSGPT